MRITYKNLEDDIVKLLTENLNDLWHLQHIIAPGDKVTAMTWRRPRSATDKIRSERQKKKRVKLSLEVEKTEFHQFDNELRILGKITEGTDLGQHHTINLDTNSKFTLKKNWTPDQLERLEEARKASKRPKILLVALDDEKATFGLVRQYGIENLGDINSSVSGKMYESDRSSSEKEYYERICKSIKNQVEKKNIPSVIIAGPGLTKKEIQNLIAEEYSELEEKIHLGNTSHTGESGLNEIIKRGIVKRVSEEDRISLETEVLEKMMEEISKNGKATYGFEKVQEAVNAGSVEKILVSDKLLQNEREKVDPLIREVRNKGGEVLIISSEHEAGNQLARMGGLGALLRYKIS